MNGRQRHLFISNDPQDEREDERTNEEILAADNAEEDRMIAWMEMMDDEHDR
jgi:hypothetical protein